MSQQQNPLKRYSDEKVEEACKALAEKYNLPKFMINEIMMSQFTFIREVITNADRNDPDSCKIIQVTHLGKFYPRWAMHEANRRFANKRKSKRIPKTD